MASGVILPIVKEALVEFSLGQCPLITWVLITKITDEFILGLYVLCAHDLRAMWYDWVRNKCHYGTLGHDYILRPI
jgi:hypothetical protein